MNAQGVEIAAQFAHRASNAALLAFDAPAFGSTGRPDPNASGEGQASSQNRTPLPLPRAKCMPLSESIFGSMPFGVCGGEGVRANRGAGG